MHPICYSSHLLHPHTRCFLINLNLDPAREMLLCSIRSMEHEEAKLHGLSDNLTTINLEIKIIQDVMNTLAHAKQKDKKADFSNDETMRRYITHIHKNNDTIFNNLVEGFPDDLPDSGLDPLTGAQITLDNHLNRSLYEVDMSKIQIPALSENQIDKIIQGLDAELKLHSAEYNKHLMTINRTYDDRSKVCESTQQSTKQDDDLKKLISRNSVKH